jgi:hypothetical protein
MALHIGHRQHDADGSGPEAHNLHHLVRDPWAIPRQHRSIHDYFSRLKHLVDLLRDIGHPVSDPAMVINALRGLNSKFSHAISVLTARKPLPSFLFSRDYLLQEEARQLHTAKMEAASALVAGSSSTPPTWPPVRPPLPPAPMGQTPPPSTSNKNVGKNNNKKRKDNDNKKLMSSSPSGGAPLPPWSASFNPWTGVVQAWPLLIWLPFAPGLLGPRLGNTSQPALTTGTFQPYDDQH